MRIGIAITTVPKRKELHQKQMEYFAKFAPENAFIYVHNDWQGIGIAKSKNKCFSELMEAGCTHLFLFDDDCWPIKDGWIELFTKSNLFHSSLTFTHHTDGTPNKHKLIRTLKGIDYFSNGCGMMLYYTRKCIEQIGGMDIRYTKWGYEHGGLSMRIKNIGMTDSTFVAPVGAMDYFYSADHHKSEPPVFTIKEKTQLAKQGMTIANIEKTSKDWKPYGLSDYVLTCFYTRSKDQQRYGKHLIADTKLLEPLINSASCAVVCFTDMIRPKEPKFKYISSVVEQGISLYNYRWLEYYKWIKRNIEYCNIIYILDGTDTEFIGEAHKIERGKIYINTERDKGNLKWLIDHAATYKGKIDIELMKIRGTDMWNCGVIYGYAEDILKLLEASIPYLKCDKMDMPIFNQIANQGLNGIDFVPVKSGFKSPDKENVYIRHK